MVSRYTRSADRKREARVNATYKGRDLSRPMWDALEDLHLSRLNKERGRRAPTNDATLNALFRRGLATATTIPDYDGWLWSCTPEGKELVKDGKRPVETN